ncbi:MAG: hypothetical protein WC441_03700 [Patescibacteria group bacterium]
MADNLGSNQYDLEPAIVKVLAWFDLFDYPLTAYEIWQYLTVKIDLGDLLVFLNSSSAVSDWQEKNGFYFLSGREDIISLRLARYNYTDRKLKIALRVSAWFRLLPFVRMIAVANLIGAHNLREGSDIDLFVITSPGRIWLSRLFCAGLAKILRLRPNSQTKRDKICLSFYVSETNLDLKSFRLDENDFYFNYWLAGLVPIYDQSGVYNQFIRANHWLRLIFPNFIWPQASPRRQLRPLKLFPDSRIFSSWESLARRWQIKIMPRALKSIMNQDSRVIISDQVIKLYLSDRREELRNKFWDKIKKYGSA